MAKVLLIYAGFGEGHRKAALSLQEFFNAPCRDLLEFCPPFIGKIYSFGYSVVTSYFPYLWRCIFFSTRDGPISFLVKKFQRIIFSSFLKYLRETKPQIIIATHFFPLVLISLLKEELNLKVISIVTDLRAHPLWVEKCVDYYFAAHSITKEDLINLGVGKEKIFTGAIPLREGFLKELSQARLREKFSLDAKPCLLFIFSLKGKFSFLKESISQLINSFNVFIIYDKNKKLKKFLLGLDSRSLKHFPYYENIWELIYLSSIIITKPGGLTVFEGLYKKKPFIFTHYIPGQEEENMDLLIEYGVAKYAKNKEELLSAIDYFKNKSGELNNNYPIKVKDVRRTLDNLICNLIVGR
ncbi:MAG: hypothetical protein KJ629_00655 [Candidatus Omnitrophica bacterium]|nr:hypothetical protein [Candidatus Omnitrophota bacterium]